MARWQYTLSFISRGCSHNFPKLMVMIKQKHLNLILRSKRVVSAFVSCNQFCQSMRYLWNFVTNNDVCINLIN